MTTELLIALLGIAVAVVIGAWQIHLTRKQVQAAREAPANRANHPGQGEGSRESENLLHRLWDSFEPELRDALALAHNQARREGKTRVSTRTFFAAVARLRPGRLRRILDRLPGESLPEPIGEDVPRESRILQEDPLLSSCVEGALLRLSRDADPEHPMSAEEVFVEVAKHGTGASVAQLRQHGVTPEKLDRLVEESEREAREMNRSR